MTVCPHAPFSQRATWPPSAAVRQRSISVELSRQLPITEFAHKAAVVADDGVPARSVLAARNMAAERRCSAAFDRRHHLHLAEADVPRVGATPRGAACDRGKDARLRRWSTDVDAGSICFVGRGAQFIARLKIILGMMAPS